MRSTPRRPTTPAQTSAPAPATVRAREPPPAPSLRYPEANYCGHCPRPRPTFDRHDRGAVHMHVRVTTDQPWEVAADVLAVPFLGEPDFSGPLGGIDRRAGGEIRALQ